jgi:hypothetical protein
MNRPLAVALLLAALVAGCGKPALRGSTRTPDAGTADRRIAAAGASAESESGPRVDVTRYPGSLILPPLDLTITDPAAVDRLERDIEALPPYTPGTRFCTIDFGTTYTLIFKDAGEPVLTAVISALGCRGVILSNGRTLFAATHPGLYVDLGAALGLPADELIPFPWPARPGAVFSPQRAS